MTVKLPHQASVGHLDWSPFAQQIVEDAEAALGFPFIVLSRFDTAARTTQPVFIGGLHGRNNQRALRLGRRLIPRFDLYTVGSVDANPLLRATFEGTEPVMGSVEDFTHGVVPPLIARIASHIAGAAHVIAIPLCVEHRVLGSLSFHQRTPHFSPQWIRTGQAFARQVALSIHNAELLEEGRRASAALEASRRLVSEAEERTRRDISEFLHSRVQSRLLVAEYRLSEIADVSEEARRRIEAVRAELEHLREHDVRQVSHRLHPEALRMGLVAALQILASQLHGVLDVRLVADDALIAAERTLPLPLKLVAFRATEEALGNVLKHAAAGCATVWLGLEPGRLRLEVTDDGRGFEVGAQPPGLGLLCLGARVESAGGCWGIESRRGGPTRVWAEVPR
ncbi:GAF domain-containing protein [Deinococcus sp. Arct2-2]|uniref:GAF domain-containing sensor histidine kinase n=1 Tax=Deinococcus sp. Arct2-2 TaxID=2568653 RepID=UPI0010A59634|nr:ATP-binding protein [Deinococcus sp. Arct2-2]THF67837.1 GAF domain-containing protein [Deinococcus sp. Arct2-2]